MTTNGIACSNCGERPCCISTCRGDLAELCFECQLVKIEGEIVSAARRGQVSRLSPHFIPGRKEFAAKVRAMAGGK